MLTDPKQHRYPYFALVYDTKDYEPSDPICGGILIAPDIVLSAAHCDGTKTPVDMVSVGKQIIYSREAGAEEGFRVQQKIRHPAFTRKSYKGDVMLIKLDRESKKPWIKLNSDSNFPSEDQLLTAIGFGDTEPQFHREAVFPTRLMEVEVNYIADQELCKSQNQRRPVLPDMLCAASRNRDTCDGDSGGPLMIPKGQDGQFEDLLVGITSWGQGSCGRIKHPVSTICAVYNASWSFIDSV